MRQADIDEGKQEFFTSDERGEFVELSREARVRDMEIEILKRASALHAGGL
jgi:hypothetical protein